MFTTKSENQVAKTNNNMNSQKWRPKYFLQDSPNDISTFNKITHSPKSIPNTEEREKQFEKSQKTHTSKQKAGSISRFSSFGKSPILRSPSLMNENSALDESVEEFLSPNIQTEVKIPKDDFKIQTKTAIINEARISVEQTVENEKRVDDNIDSSFASRLESLPLLQQKLKNEAKKLEHWKNDLIYDLEKKEKQLNEKTALIECLRKSNLELQMNSENVSLKLKDEIEQREITEKKISGNRDLCEVIKTQIELTRSACSSTVQTCFKTKAVHKVIENLIQTVLDNIVQLRLEHSDAVSRHNDLFNIKMENEKAHKKDLELHLAEKLSLIEKYQKECSSKYELEQSILQMSNALKQNIEKCQNMHVEFEELQKTYTEFQKNMQDMLEDRDRDLLTLKENIYEKENRIKDFSSECMQLSKNLKNIHMSLDSAKNETAERNQKIIALQDLCNKHEADTKTLQLEKNKIKIDYDHSIASHEMEVKELKTKFNEIYPDLIIMIKECNETLKSYEVAECEMFDRMENLRKELDEERNSKRLLAIELTERFENEKKNLRDIQKENIKSIEMKNCHIVDLEQKLVVLENEVMSYQEIKRTNEKEYSEAIETVKNKQEIIMEKDEKMAKMTILLAEKESDRKEAFKQIETIRAQLLNELEKQQEKMCQTIKLKEKEIKGLKTSLTLDHNDSEKLSKKMERKMADNEAQIEKSTKQIKELTEQKKELSKELNTKINQLIKLEKENNSNVIIANENVKKIANLNEMLENTSKENGYLSSRVSEQEDVIQSLRELEKEYKAFKHQVLDNSPPSSTQMPATMEENLERTPKSPFLSEKLNYLNILKTPQKTPRGILKQPGSESKRRRVLILSPDENSYKEISGETSRTSSLELPVDQQSRARTKNVQDRKSPIPTNRNSNQNRNSNVRKTPGSGAKCPSKIAKNTDDSVVTHSWFDCDIDLED